MRPFNNKSLFFFLAIKHDWERPISLLEKNPCDKLQSYGIEPSQKERPTAF